MNLLVVLILCTMEEKKKLGKYTDYINIGSLSHEIIKLLPKVAEGKNKRVEEEAKAILKDMIFGDTS